jgi:uncharacterized protein YbjT (DUF2867 family)
MSTPAVFIFGATGTIGRALVNELLPDHKAGRLKLVAAVRRPDAAAALESHGLETQLIDLDGPSWRVLFRLSTRCAAQTTYSC